MQDLDNYQLLPEAEKSKLGVYASNWQQSH